MLELNRIYNENCLETMARMPDSFVDLTVTSPPYDDLRAYRGYSFDFEAIARELYRVTRRGGVVVWVVGDATVRGSETGTSFKQALYFKSVGFNLHDTMIFRKTNPLPLTHNRYEQEFEYMFVLSKGRPRTFHPIMTECKQAGRKDPRQTFYQTRDHVTPTRAHTNAAVNQLKRIGNVWDIQLKHGVKGHPAQFPEQLANDHILSWSDEGDVVYDPFMGAGTTAKMAILNHRSYIGSEIAEAYCAIARARVDELCGSS